MFLLQASFVVKEQSATKPNTGRLAANNTFGRGRSWAGSVMLVFIPTGTSSVVLLFNLGQPFEPEVRSCWFYTAVQNVRIFRIVTKGCLHDTGGTSNPVRLHPSSLLWLCIRLHDTNTKCHKGAILPMWVHPGCCTGLRVSFCYENSFQCQVNAVWLFISYSF